MEVRMKMSVSLLCSALLAAAAPAFPSPAAAQATAESKLQQSSVSLMVEPQLNDGRLVIRLAAKNLGAAPAPFGPANVSITKPNGTAIAIYPLSSLIEEVRLAAGLPAATAPPAAPTHGAYAAPQQTTRDGGQLDLTGFTGGSAVGGDEYVRRSRSSRKVKPTISEAEAEQQINVLKQAILQDSTLAPGQVAAGQVVSEQLKFAKREDRTLHVRVRVAGEEHGFTIMAPAE
jgi:hypothetical protein